MQGGIRQTTRKTYLDQVKLLAFCRCTWRLKLSLIKSLELVFRVLASLYHGFPFQKKHSQPRFKIHEAGYPELWIWIHLCWSSVLKRLLRFQFIPFSTCTQRPTQQMTPQPWSWCSISMAQPSQYPILCTCTVSEKTETQLARNVSYILGNGCTVSLSAVLAVDKHTEKAEKSTFVWQLNSKHWTNVTC